MPEQGANTGKLPALDVIDGSALRECIVFVVNRHLAIPLHALVIVISGKLLEVRREHVLLNPPVEPHELRLVLIH